MSRFFTYLLLGALAMPFYAQNSGENKPDINETVIETTDNCEIEEPRYRWQFNLRAGMRDVFRAGKPPDGAVLIPSVEFGVRDLGPGDLTVKNFMFTYMEDNDVPAFHPGGFFTIWNYTFHITDNFNISPTGEFATFPAASVDKTYGIGLNTHYKRGSWDLSTVFVKDFGVANGEYFQATSGKDVYGFNVKTTGALGHRYWSEFSGPTHVQFGIDRAFDLGNMSIIPFVTYNHGFKPDALTGSNFGVTLEYPRKKD